MIRIPLFFSDELLRALDLIRKKIVRHIIFPKCASYKPSGTIRIVPLAISFLHHFGDCAHAGHFIIEKRTDRNAYTIRHKLSSIKNISWFFKIVSQRFQWNIVKM